MVRKYLSGKQWSWLEESRHEIKRIDCEFSGYAAAIHIDKVRKRIFAGDVLLIEDGCFWLTFLPDAEKWCMTALHDCEGRLFEWYFDVTNGNFPGGGDPYFDDIYLDVAVTVDGKITILDEDELLAALDSGDISHAEYLEAYRTCGRILCEWAADLEKIGRLYDACRAAFG